MQHHDCPLYWFLIMYRNSYLLQYRFAKIFLQYCILLQANDLNDFKLFEWFCCCYNNLCTDNREINNCNSRFNDLNVSRAYAFLPLYIWHYFVRDSVNNLNSLENSVSVSDGPAVVAALKLSKSVFFILTIFRSAVCPFHFVAGVTKSLVSDTFLVHVTRRELTNLVLL